MKIRMGDQEKEHEGFSCPAKAHQGWCYRDDCVGAVCQGMKEVGYGGALLPGTGLVIHTDDSVPAEYRARIVAALEAEIGDRATAERLAGVVVTALEGGE